MAPKRLGRLDEQRLGFAPRSSCRGDDRFGPCDQAGEPSPVLAGRENLPASFELRDGVELGTGRCQRGRLPRADDVGEERGGDSLVRSRARWPAGYEFLDLVEKQVQHVLIEGLEQMVAAGQLDESGSRNVASQLSAGVDRHERIAHAMQDQGRHPDRRQNIGDVDLIVGPQQGNDSGRTRHGALESPEPLDERLILDAARGVQANENPFTPVPFERPKE